MKVLKQWRKDEGCEVLINGEWKRGYIKTSQWLTTTVCICGAGEVQVYKVEEEIRPRRSV